MATGKFPAEAKEILLRKLRTYFEDELDQELGRFDAEFLLEFFEKELGAFYYNQGVTDARAMLSKKLEDLDEAIYLLEKPTELTR